MLVRQKIILHLIDKMGGETSFIRLVKTAFLYRELVESKKLDTFYGFVPYKFGPYSFNLGNELKSLIKNGYICSANKKTIKLNNNIELPPIDFEEEIRYFTKKYLKVPNNELFEIVYSHYPWFTINAEKHGKRRLSRPTANHLIYIVGYEGLQIDTFLNLLLKKGIQQVIDVRSNPISRQYGYHKTTFDKLCKHMSIEYLHYPELGITSEKRNTVQSTDSLKQLLAWYYNHIAATNKKSIKSIEEEIKSKSSVLLCMEADPNLCHRLQLARIISKETGLEIFDLRRDLCKTISRERGFS